MAVSGGMTTAYWVQLVAGKPKPERTTYPSTKCDSPDDAVIIVRDGDRATVKGGDMAEFWRLWEPKQGGE